MPAETDAVVVSLDGVNVLLSEAGKRKGRKAQRPKSGEADSQKTAYRNAMVGSISYYSAEDSIPERLESRGMPEKKFLTFRNQFEQEVHACFEKLPSDTRGIVVTDGHLSLEKYIPGTELFKHCDILIDFYHAMEGGQNILNLRTYLKSGRWDIFWNHYKADSYQRSIAA